MLREETAQGVTWHISTGGLSATCTQVAPWFSVLRSSVVTVVLPSTKNGKGDPDRDMHPQSCNFTFGWGSALPAAWACWLYDIAFSNSLRTRAELAASLAFCAVLAASLIS